jgi:MFS family permease
MMVFGSLIFALSSDYHALVFSLILLALSDGMDATAHSLITSVISSTEVSTIYTGITVVSGIGGMVAGPVIALTFEGGMHAGGRWIALPFLIVLALCFSILFAVFYIKPEEADTEGTTIIGRPEDTRSLSFDQNIDE